MNGNVIHAEWAVSVASAYESCGICLKTGPDAQNRQTGSEDPEREA